MCFIFTQWASQVALVVENPSANAGDTGDVGSGFVITFLPRNNCLLISWLQLPFAVILEPKKIKFVTVSIVSPSICHGVMGLDAMILDF